MSSLPLILSMETKSEARAAKKEDLAQYLIDLGISIEDESTREELLDHVLRKMGEDTPEEEVNVVEEVVEEINLKDDLELLAASGFSSKEQVSSFLKGLGREKEAQKKRKQELSDYESVIDARVQELRKKEEHLAAKGEEIQKKLVEQKTLYTKNYELKKKLDDIGLTS